MFGKQVLDNWTNFRTYGLPSPVGLLRADAHRPPFRADLCNVRLRLPAKSPRTSLSVCSLCTVNRPLSASSSTLSK